MSDTSLYTVSSSPHIRAEDTIPKIMYTVMIALLPATLFAVYSFGYKAAVLIAISMVSSVFFEWAYEKIINRPIMAFDGSAALTGLLIALNLPVGVPWWLPIVGSFVAIILVKQISGGLGANIFNPAMIARVFLLVSWPVEMTTYTSPIDATTTATPLTAIKTKLLMHQPIAEALASFDMKQLLLGQHGGSMGEISVIAILIGAAILFYKKYITWHIPITYIATVAVLATIFWKLFPETQAPPLLHLLSGGLFLAAFFMATDMVTSPVTHKGMIIYGFGCGFLTILIRAFGAYPEGASFGILLMNLATPMIDTLVKPKKFGEVPTNA